MQQLNFPRTYAFDTRQTNDKREILDPLRRQFVALTPEEWVRQNLVQFLVQDMGYPRGLIAIEKYLELHGTSYRADIVVHDRQGTALLLAECKEPSVKISQDTFDQIARYNRVLHARYLLVSNGLEHYCYAIDREKKQYRFLEQLPRYEQL
ncbi:MAG: hypothetical protein ACI906_002491 [Candidatus Latescibacterota bacterium]|jgi:hypothetical protein